MGRHSKTIIDSSGLDRRDIRLFRQKKNLSQEELALFAGLDRTYIGGVERGERNISLLNIERISQALDIEVFKLFKNSDE